MLVAVVVTIGILVAAVVTRVVLGSTAVEIVGSRTLMRRHGDVLGVGGHRLAGTCQPRSRTPREASKTV